MNKPLTVSERQERFRQHQKARIARMEAELAESRSPLARLSAVFGAEVDAEASELLGLECAYHVCICGNAEAHASGLKPAVNNLVMAALDRGMRGFPMGWRRRQEGDQFIIEALRLPASSSVVAAA